MPLTRNIKKGIFNGILCSVTLTDQDLQGPLAGKKIETLIYAMGMGNIFINIASGSYPEGEIRGQLR
uniref:CHRD domain-containing protein n=1 Tax=candidate division WOR-3 bacterium TaxID=2052148 RepID=A0A7V3V064_UNCW3